MKALTGIVALGLSLSCHCGIAQTWEELFAQKQTQKKYLVLQIGALEIQSKLLSEAADISRVGLQTIGNWKGLEKELHGTFFDSRRRTGPLTRQSLEELTDSRLLPAALLEMLETSLNYGESASMDPVFLSWSENIHRQMKTRCLNLSGELALILSDGLEMGDGERANRLDSVATELAEIRAALLRVQVLSTHRLGMEAEKARLERTLVDWSYEE